MNCVFVGGILSIKERNEGLSGLDRKEEKEATVKYCKWLIFFSFHCPLSSIVAWHVRIQYNKKEMSGGYTWIIYQGEREVVELLI